MPAAGREGKTMTRRTLGMVEMGRASKENQNNVLSQKAQQRRTPRSEVLGRSKIIASQGLQRADSLTT